MPILAQVVFDVLEELGVIESIDELNANVKIVCKGDILPADVKKALAPIVSELTASFVSPATSDASGASDTVQGCSPRSTPPCGKTGCSACPALQKLTKGPINRRN